MNRLYAAVDLGASSGRVVVGRVDDGSVRLEEVHRFWNGATRLPEGYRWDILHLWREIIEGLRRAGERGPLVSIGIDSWAIDHGLVDSDGALIANPWHYRDGRTSGVGDAFLDRFGAQELYAVNGLQSLSFTTMYQLLATKSSSLWPSVARVLLIPDLLVYWLTGSMYSEVTNASTTGMMDVTSREWSRRILAELALPEDLLAPLVGPGHEVGPLLPLVQELTGLGPNVTVTMVASHDTASAVVGTPLTGQREAFVACGTWALAGIELDAPVLTEPSRRANFTNEAGADGTTRYLKNVAGLWVLNELLQEWRRQDSAVDMAGILEAASLLRPSKTVIDINDASLVEPGDMSGRIGALCAAADAAVPSSQSEMVRLVVDSLAAALARTIADAGRLSGVDVKAIHLVGGGARNKLLCKATAEAAGLPLLAGPVEATALGNLLIQARTHGDLTGGLPELRSAIHSSYLFDRYEP